MFKTIKKLLGKFEFEIKNESKVKEVRDLFQDEFGTVMFIYKLTAEGKINTGRGSRVADDKTNLTEVSCGNKAKGKIVVTKDMTVDDVEHLFANNFGIGIQIFERTGQKLAPNEMRLVDVKNMRL